MGNLSPSFIYYLGFRPLLVACIKETSHVTYPNVSPPMSVGRFFFFFFFQLRSFSLSVQQESPANPCLHTQVVPRSHSIFPIAHTSRASTYVLRGANGAQISRPPSYRFVINLFLQVVASQLLCMSIYLAARRHPD